MDFITVSMEQPLRFSPDIWGWYGKFKQDCHRLKAERLVLEKIYAKNYLGNQGFYRLSIPHYLLRGERTGCRPNPLFDPIFFGKKLTRARSTGSRCLLLDYVDHWAASDLAPSQEFDPNWYSWQNPDWRSSLHPNPFLHCLHNGLAEGRDPAPGIDVQQLSSTMGLNGEPLSEHMFGELAQCGRLSPAYAIYTVEELESRQREFYKRIEVTFHRTPDRRANRHLVFVQAGGGFYRNYLAKPREFDVLVNYYEPPSGGISQQADIVAYQRGTKTTAIKTLLEHRPELLLRYDAVLFLDDDIELSVCAIESLFESMERHNLALAQPALSADSDCVWRVFKQPHVGEKVQLVNSVEIMMPALSREALASSGWAFSEAVSGFGVDLLLGKACSEGFKGRAGVVGSSVAVHEKRIDDKGGAYYNYMRKNGINPKFELMRIIQKHSLIADFYYLGEQDLRLDCS